MRSKPQKNEGLKDANLSRQVFKKLEMYKSVEGRIASTTPPY